MHGTGAGRDEDGSPNYADVIRQERRNADVLYLGDFGSEMERENTKPVTGTGKTPLILCAPPRATLGIQ